MLQFADTFKIYLFKHKHEVKLSIRVSSHVVDTYRLGQPAFELLLTACDDVQGADIDEMGVSWFAQRKHSRKPTEHVRISAWVSSACRDYRADIADINALKQEYARQKSNIMPWDNERLETHDE